MIVKTDNIIRYKNKEPNGKTAEFLLGSLFFIDTQNSLFNV